eukprot:13463791-Heterocapsa_arctica.AAC.1
MLERRPRPLTMPTTHMRPLVPKTELSLTWPALERLPRVCRMIWSSVSSSASAGRMCPSN